MDITTLDVQSNSSFNLKLKMWKIEPRHKWVLIRKFVRTERKVGDVVQPGEGTPGFEARSQRGTVVAAAEGTGLLEGDLVIYTNFPMDIPDIEELTGEKGLHLVLDEEIYARFRLCHL